MDITIYPNTVFERVRHILNSGDSRSVAVKKNVVGSLLVKGVSIAVSLLLVPVTLDYVSSELYGIWLTLSSIMVWLNFFDVGFTLGLKNKLTEAIAHQNWELGRSLVSTTYFATTMIFMPLLLILQAVLPLISWTELLNVSAVYQVEIVQVLRILICLICLQMILNALSSVAAAFQMVALSTAFPVIGNLLALIAIYILTKTVPPSLEVLAWAIGAMPVLVLAISTIILYNGRFKAVAPSIKSIDRSKIKGLFGLGVKFFIIQIQVVIMYQTTNVLISNVDGPDAVTSYNIAYRYLSITFMLLNIMVSPLWPAFTDAYTKKEYGWMRSIYRKFVKIVLMMIGTTVLMVIVSPIVYKIWVGDKASVPSFLTIAVGIYVAVHCWDTLQVMLINGTGKVKLQSYVTLIGLIFNIPLSILLGRHLGMGAVGVVMSMTLINVIYCMFFTRQIRQLISNRATGLWAQ